MHDVIVNQQVSVRTASRGKWASKFASVGTKVFEATISFIFLFVAWEGVVRLFNVAAYIFPPPSAVFVTLWRGLVTGAFYQAIIITFSEVVIGFLLGGFIGISIGILLVSVPFLYRYVFPYIIAIQTIPKVAIAPLFIIWFGFGIEFKIIIVALSCIFPVLVNTIAGLNSTESDRVSLIRALCGSRWQLLRYVQIPSALPYIFAGLNTAVVLAIIGAIVGEFVGAKQGIGVTILQANFSLDLATVFAMLVVLSVGGIILSAIVQAIERRVVFWHGKSVK